MMAIINLVMDGEVTTKEQAAAVVDHETRERANFYAIPVEEARNKLLSQIGYVTCYLSHKQADNVMELFGTEHPVFGKSHPSAEDAYRMGWEYSQRTKKTEKN
jgi:hypothetical protein